VGGTKGGRGIGGSNVKAFANNL